MSTTGQQWKLQGACNGEYDLFFPTHETPHSEIQRAISICENECPVFNQCREGRRKYKIGIVGGVLRGLDTNGPDFD